MADHLPNIIDQIARGDEQGIAGLFRLYGQKLMAFSKSITRSAEAAEEIVEDVLLQLWIHRGTIREINNLQLYLYTAVKNRSLNLLSRRSRELITDPFDFLQIDLVSHDDPQDALITREMQQKIQAAIDALPPRCKMIFKLIREDGLKYKEVAAVLNISVNTIDAQMAIAMNRICAALAVKKQPARWLKRFSLFF